MMNRTKLLIAISVGFIIGSTVLRVAGTPYLYTIPLYAVGAMGCIVAIMQYLKKNRYN